MKWFLALLLATTTLLFAKDKDGFVVLPQGVVYKGDYFATGGSIEISGDVKGDVFAFGSHVVVDGKVEGDVIAAGGTIEIGGEVLGNVRIAGGQVEISGTVGRNATVMGGNVQLTGRGLIQGNAVFTGGVVEIAGRIGQKLTLTASQARFSGQVGNNIKAYVGALRLSATAEVGGDLEYTSSEEARISPDAKIKGQTTYHPSAVRQVFKGEWRKGFILGTRFVGILMNFLFSFVIGLVIIKFFPRRVKGALSLLEKRPWKAFWVGLLTTILLPLACLILFITILGFPIALALVALSLLGFYSAKTFPILYFSNRLFPKIGLKKNSLVTFFSGLVAFFIIQQAPILGSLLSLAFLFLGLGAVLLGRLPAKKS